MPSTRAQSPGQRLAGELRERGYSVLGFARMTLPPGADERRVNARRRLIAKWINDEHAISDGSAEMLATALDLDPDTFKTPTRSRFSRRDELAALREEIEASNQRLEQVARDLDEMRRELARRKRRSQ